MIALQQDSIVTLQTSQVAPISLAANQIEVAPAEGRSARDEINILGTEHYYIDLSHRIYGAPGNIINSNPLSHRNNRRRKSNSLSSPGRLCAFQPENNLYLEVTPRSLNLSEKSAKGWVLLGGKVMNEFSITGSTMGLSRSQHMDSLEEIRLPLGVIPVDHHQMRRQPQLQVAVITKVGQT